MGGGGRGRGKERERGRELYGKLEKRAGEESGISKVAQSTTKYIWYYFAIEERQRKQKPTKKGARSGI